MSKEVNFFNLRRSFGKDCKFVLLISSSVIVWYLERRSSKVSGFVDKSLFI